MLFLLFILYVRVVTSTGKMSNDRNKTLDCKATKIFTLLHSDLAGPIQPLAKVDYKYVINSMLKYKSDTLLATTKYLADIAPYGHVKCLRTDNGTEFTSEFNSYLYLKESNIILCIKTVMANFIFYS